MILDSALNSFLTQLVADGRSPHTVAQYERHLRAFGYWLGREAACATLGDLEHETIARYMSSPEARTRPDGRPRKPTTMNAMRSSLRGFFHYLHRSGAIGSDPARVLRSARVGERRPTPMKEPEVTRLFETLRCDDSSATRRDHALFAFLLGTGARLGSALALRVEDLELDAGEALLRELKGGGEQRVFLSDDVVQLLRHLLRTRTSGAVFLGHGDQSLTTRHARRRFSVWLDRAGLPKGYSPHSLRHTFATRLYQRTGDIALTKEALGHACISSTMVYARASQDQVRAAVLAV